MGTFCQPYPHNVSCVEDLLLGVSIVMTVSHVQIVNQDFIWIHSMIIVIHVTKIWLVAKYVHLLLFV